MSKLLKIFRLICDVCLEDQEYCGCYDSENLES